MGKAKTELKEILIGIKAAFQGDLAKIRKRRDNSGVTVEEDQAAAADAALAEKLPEIKGHSLHWGTRRISIVSVALTVFVCFMGFNLFASGYVERQAETALSETNNYHLALDKLTAKLAEEDLTAATKSTYQHEKKIIERDYAGLKLPVSVSIINLADQEYLTTYATEDELQLVEFYNEHKNDKDYDFSAVEEIITGDRYYYVTRSAFILDSGAAASQTQETQASAEASDTRKAKQSDASASQAEDVSPVLMYVDETAIVNMISGIDSALLIVGLIAAAIGIIGGVISGGRINRSVNRLKIQMGRIVSTDREKYELETTGCKEFDEITTMVNEMSEKVAQAQTIQKQVFQNASHELRTPLMSIQGYAEGIQAGVFKNHQEAAGIIIQESRKMSDLVDEILFISRIDEGTVQMRVDNTNLRQILEDCREEVGMAAQQKGVMLVEEIEDEDYDIRGDEKQLSKALGNIISNAVRYARTKVAISMKLRPDRLFIITVCDDGQGISDEDLPHIFERFYKGSGGNFGIGLSITQDVIEKHGGSVAAENSPEGTLFTVILPRTDAI